MESNHEHEGVLPSGLALIVYPPRTFEPRQNAYKLVAASITRGLSGCLPTGIR